jgi:hypothetical protein
MESVGLVIALIVFLIVIVVAVGRAKGPLEPASCSDAQLQTNLRLHREWISKYFRLPFDQQMKPTLKRMFDQKTQYIKEAELELLFRQAAVAVTTVSKEFEPFFADAAESEHSGSYRPESVTGFRINKPSIEHAHNNVRAATVADLVKQPDLSTVPPVDLGTAIAMTLNTSCTLERLSDEERSLAHAANIPVDLYYRELLVLAGFAQDYSILYFIGDSPAGKQVLSGYRKAWQDVGSSSADGASLLELFLKRRPVYEKAAFEDDEKPLGDGIAASRLAFTFGDCIQHPSCTIEEAEAAQRLVTAYMPNHYSAHFEGTYDVLVAANLITAD